MKLFSVLIAALTRKVRAIVAEYRTLVADAKVTEQRIIGRARGEVNAIMTQADTDTKAVYEEVINKIAKL